MTFLSHRQQAGDTIVEVLISIAVVSLVLVGAFLVANNSTQGIQDNQERTIAQQHLQSQVEALRSMSPDDINRLDNGGETGYCRALPDNAYILATVKDNCAPVAIGGANGFSTVKKDGTLFTFNVTWDSVKGGEASQEFVYRFNAF